MRLDISKKHKKVFFEKKKCFFDFFFVWILIFSWKKDKLDPKLNNWVPKIFVYVIFKIFGKKWPNWNIIKRVKVNKFIFLLLFHEEKRNSKGRSGYTFWLILQKTFAAFSHRKLKVVQIWSPHQSKALIFYFGIKKILSWIFEHFFGNRQTKFHILKFRVCVNTH